MQSHLIGFFSVVLFGLIIQVSGTAHGSLFDGSLLTTPRKSPSDICPPSFNVAANQTLTSTNLQCMITTGYQQVSIAVLREPDCSISPSFLQNIKTAQLAGFTGVDVILSPADVGSACANAPAGEQVEDVIKIFANSQVTIDRFWLDVTLSDSKGWSIGSGCDANQQWLGEALRHARHHLPEHTVGILSSKGDWQQLLCGVDSFHWYALFYVNQDGQDNMNDYAANQFGGWPNPAAKQFTASTDLCGLVFNSDVRMAPFCK